MRFYAVDPYLESNIVQPTETKYTGHDFVQWGDGNRYPEFLLDLYKTVPTLASIINGTLDFVGGDAVTIAPLRDEYTGGEMNTRGDLIEDQVKDLAKDYLLYGGFALEVIRDNSGSVAEVYYVDVRFLRMNTEGDVFYYCEKWGTGSNDFQIYPAFVADLDWASLTPEERDRHASSIVYIKKVHTQVYPAPLYASAVKSCDMERNIDDYHLNSLSNGFASSMMVNFNNGVPSSEQQEEIESNFTEKFTGHQNAGRIVFSWNKNKDSAADIVTPDVKDFGERYEALAKRSRQQLFTAFRANPNLFGIPTDGNGFAEEQYEASFKLYNRTMVRPIQKMIVRAYERIYQRADVMTITPFSLEETTEKQVQ